MSYTVREGLEHSENAVGVPALGVGLDGTYRALPAADPDPFSASEKHVPSAATAAVLTFPAPGPGLANVLTGVALSYSATPTGGRLTIADGAETVFDLDIPAAGMQVIAFNPPRRGRPNRALVVTLASGDGSVQGKLNALGHYLTRVRLVGALTFEDETESGLLPLLF